ncbi:MAG: AAA family ATPase [Myxococcota bacterium]
MTTASRTQNFSNEFKRLIAAKCTLIQLETYEEERAERLLGEVASSLFARPVPIMRWTCTEGLTGPEGPMPETREPAAVLDYILCHDETAIFVLEDFHPFLDGDPRLERRLRDIARRCAANYVTVILIGPGTGVPEGLQRDINTLDVPLPEEREIADVLARVLKESSRNAGVAGDLSEEQRTLISRAALGLTERQAAEAFRKVFAGKTGADDGLARMVTQEKRQLVRKAIALDFIDDLPTLDDVGGLDNFKAWLDKRRAALGQAARDANIAPPKGVLLTGVSGCGKSFCAKAIASFWHLPLMRFNMGDLYASVSGVTPEEAIRQTIRIAETVAPCVLWIDEIEAGVSINTQKAGQGSASRVFASFLNWMQEKQAFVFVAATANVIDLLPPEIVRKGRFDEIFFVGLPSQEERLDIFRIHLKKAGADPEQFDLKALAKTTNGYNGAEIEQIVTRALVEAFNAQRPLNQNDLVVSTGALVPLSVTMREEIGRMERWAHSRAAMASAPKGVGTSKTSS